MAEFEIHECVTHEAFEQCIRLQRKVWGYDDLDVMPRHAYVVTRNSGGFALGAFLPDQSLIGYVHTWLAKRDGAFCFYSHMLAVDPEYRSNGIGRSLKLAQRAEALRRGAERIVWTFDPLQARNAHFNFNQLGVTCANYEVNYYGSSSSSPLHQGLDTDRLFVDWWLRSPRVEQIASGGQPDPLQPIVEIPIPCDLSVLKSRSMEEARSTQRAVRTAFQQFLARSLYVGGFRRELDNSSCAYLLFESTR